MMSKKSKIYKDTPSQIKALLYLSDGWLVGSSMENTLLEKPIKDYDIIVEDPEKFMRAIKVLSSDKFTHSINSYGGLKFDCKDYEIDVWVQQLGCFIKSANKFTYAYNFSRNILIQNI